MKRTSLNSAKEVRQAKSISQAFLPYLSASKLSHSYHVTIILLTSAPNSLELQCGRQCHILLCSKISFSADCKNGQPYISIL